jgi:hypothetical protein
MIFTQSSVAVRESTVLYTIQSKAEITTIQATRMVKGDPGKHYVGLRESKEQAFERAKLFNPEVLPEECVLIRLDFTPIGWMHCTTEMQGTIPLLYHKNFINHPIPWGTWHFNAALPVQMHDADTNEVMMTVTFHQF